MKSKIILLLLLMFVQNKLFSQSFQKNFIDQPFIELIGTSELEIVPDEIYVKIILNENDKKGKISIESQEKEMIKKLKSINIDTDSCLSVIDFNGVFQRKVLASNEVLKIKSYELLVNNGVDVSEVFEALDKIEISNISISKTSHSKLEEFKEKNRLKALTIAKEKANDYANALNQSIGKAIYIKELSSNSNNYGGNMVNEINVQAYGTNKYGNEPKLENISVRRIKITSSILAKFILN